jgi:hypothetical protein
MYQIIRTYGLVTALKKEAAPAIMSLLVAEVFYKFHSFTLECFAFLATWYVVSWLLAHLVEMSQKIQNQIR